MHENEDGSKHYTAADAFADMGLPMYAPSAHRWPRETFVRRGDRPGTTPAEGLTFQSIRDALAETRVSPAVMMHNIANLLFEAGVVSICDMDGDTEDERGGEHYWHCEKPAVALISLPDGAVVRVCAEHAEDQEVLMQVAAL